MTPFVIAGDALWLYSALELNRRFGMRHLPREGEPMLNRALLAAGVVDGAVLPIAPLITGATGPTIVQPPTPSATLELRSLCE